MLFVGRHGNINKNPDIEVLVAHDYLMLYIVVRKCQKNIGATPYLALIEGGMYVVESPLTVAYRCSSLCRGLPATHIIRILGARHWGFGKL